MSFLSSRPIQRFIHFLQRHAKWIPWFSLVGGIVGALFMERSPRTSVIVFILAVLSWIVVFVLGSFTKSKRENTKDKAIRLFVTWLTQNLMQQSLFFVIPFYVGSTVLHGGQIFFTSVLIAVALFSLWDPFFEKMVNTLARRVSLQVFVVFVTIHAVGPFVGFSNRASLTIAAIVAALGAPMVVFKYTEKNLRRSKSALAFGITSIVMVATSYLFAPWILPPAPLRIVEGGFGTGYKDHSLLAKGNQFTTHQAPIFCASSIKGPSKMRDVVFHRWFVNNRQTDRIPLRFKGGREHGFRTYSKKKRVSNGDVVCQIETATRQIIGRFKAEMTSPPQP